MKALLSQGNERLSISNDIAEEENQNNILDASTQNSANHSYFSDVEVLVEGGHSPHHPNLFLEPAVQGQNKGKGKGKRKPTTWAIIKDKSWNWNRGKWYCLKTS